MRGLMAGAIGTGFWAVRAMPAWPAFRELARQILSRRSAIRFIRLAGALALVIGGAAWIVHDMRRPSLPAAAPARPEAAAPAWQDIADTPPLFSLTAPEFAEGPANYAARRHGPDGSREDTLSLGTLDGASQALRLRILQRPATPVAPIPLYAAVAHEAAQAGLSVERSGLPEILPTRFGRFEIADVALAGTSGETARACAGFRLDRDAPALTITGLACGAGGAPLPRSALACLIDRLALAVSGDAALTAFFTASEANRDPSCPTATVAAAEAAEATPAPDSNKSGKLATSRKSLRRR